MFKKLKYKIKKTNLGILILKFKFLFNLGLEKEAKKYASILGYNYNSSKWYEQSYKILNKDYNVILKKDKKEKKKLFNKIINIIKKD